MREQYCRFGGWNLADDDVPRVPDCDPMSSAQHRRWVKSLGKQRLGLEHTAHGVHIEEH